MIILIIAYAQWSIITKKGGVEKSRLLFTTET